MSSKEEVLDSLISIIRTVQADLNEALDAYQENPKCGLYSIEEILIPAQETIEFFDFYDDNQLIEQFIIWANQILEKYSEDDDLYAWYRETVLDTLNEIESS
jgi:hypothetical protein